MDWMDAVLQAEPELLHATDKALCLSLWSHMGSSGVCFPSQERVARVAGMSKRNAQRGLRRLERLGWVEREKATADRAQAKLREKASSSGRAGQPDPRQHVYWARIPDNLSPVESGIGAQLASIEPEIGDKLSSIEHSIGDRLSSEQATGCRTEPYQGTNKSSADESARTKSPTRKPKTNGTPEALGLVMAAWRTQAGTPSRAEQNKQAAAAKRIAGAHPPERIAAALAGLSLLFPFSNGQPWDLFDLERHFSKAAARGERDLPKRTGPFVDEVDVIEAAARAEPRPNYAAGAST